MAATIYCTTNTVFHQHSLTTARAQFTPVLRRTTLSTSTSFSSSSSTTSISHADQQSIIRAIKSDENNNDQHQIDHIAKEFIDEVLYITSDDDDDDDHQDDGIDVDEHDMADDIDAEGFLSLIGLRSKMKKPVRPNLTLRPLTQRLASPVCLLPLPKYIERVRQALYVRLPFLKFLTITCNTESFCTTDDTARAQSLLPRSTAQTRALSSLNKSPRKQRLSKAAFIGLASNTLLQKTGKISMNNPVHSALKCHVVLDRLEQSTIDQIMQNSSEDDDTNVTSVSTSQRLLCEVSARAHHRLSLTTNETMPTENIVIKRKSTAREVQKSKRLKLITNDSPTISVDQSINESASLTYQRIYLKCFLCSKRVHVDGQASNSDVLHSHWLEHGGKLSLNIYDSEIDSILTRVVEFFHSPKQQILEGKVKTVFILNSKEIRCTSINHLSSKDALIVID